MIVLLLIGLSFLKTEVDSVVIRTEAEGNPDAQCVCVPFFTCPKESIVSKSNGGNCSDNYFACCKDATPATIDPPALPGPLCATKGTLRGFCVEFDDCRHELIKHLNVMRFPDFVQRFGCGRESPGSNMRVCCNSPRSLRNQ